MVVVKARGKNCVGSSVFAGCKAPKRNEWFICEGCIENRLGLDRTLFGYHYIVCGAGANLKQIHEAAKEVQKIQVNRYACVLGWWHMFVFKTSRDRNDILKSEFNKDLPTSHRLLAPDEILTSEGLKKFQKEGGFAFELIKTYHKAFPLPISPKYEKNGYKQFEQIKIHLSDAKVSEYVLQIGQNAQIQRIGWDEDKLNNHLRKWGVHDGGVMADDADSDYPTSQVIQGAKLLGSLMHVQSPRSPLLSEQDPEEDSDGPRRRRDSMDRLDRLDRRDRDRRNTSGSQPADDKIKLAEKELEDLAREESYLREEIAKSRPGSSMYEQQSLGRTRKPRARDRVDDFLEPVEIILPDEPKYMEKQRKNKRGRRNSGSGHFYGRDQKAGFYASDEDVSIFDGYGESSFLTYGEQIIQQPNEYKESSWMDSQTMFVDDSQDFTLPHVSMNTKMIDYSSALPYVSQFPAVYRNIQTEQNIEQLKRDIKKLEKQKQEFINKQQYHKCPDIDKMIERKKKSIQVALVAKDTNAPRPEVLHRKLMEHFGALSRYSNEALSKKMVKWHKEVTDELERLRKRPQQIQEGISLPHLPPVKEPDDECYDARTAGGPVSPYDYPIEGNSDDEQDLLQTHADIDDQEQINNFVESLHQSIREGRTNEAEHYIMSLRVLYRDGLPRDLFIDENAESNKNLFMHTCKQNRPDMVELLLKEHRAHDRDAFEDGTNPLCYSVRNEYEEVINLLVKHRADVNVSTKGYTPLLTAIIVRNVNIIRTLSDCKHVKWLTTTQANLNALDLAVLTGDLEIVKVVVTRMPVDHINSYKFGLVALVYAMMKGFDSIVEYLLDNYKKMDLSLRLPGGYKVTHYAEKLKGKFPKIHDLINRRTEEGSDDVVDAIEGMGKLHV